VSPPTVAVVGSVNLDLVVRCARLPRPGETLSGATFARYPGGKGANQAVAAARLGARVSLTCAVGRDPFAEEALVDVRRAGINLRLHERDASTGVALIEVAEDGETTIVVAPGANAELAAGDVDVTGADAVLCQLEVPDEAVKAAAGQASFLCVNAAPARPVDVQPDLLVVNRLEHEVVGAAAALTAVTLGVEGAVLLEDGEEVARARPPTVEAVDGTAAGDAFTACLLVSLLEGRPREEALRRACAAGALAASRHGAQPSLPTAADVDAILA
jgi:ribokinase